MDNGPKVFSLVIGGKEESVFMDWLKPHLRTAEVSPQMPPTRGHPVNQVWRGAMWCQ